MVDPRGQGKHTPPSPKLPRAHGAHADAPGGDSKPAGQRWQNARAPSLKLPAGQGLHSGPSAPGGHLRQAACEAAPSALVNDSGQGVHASELGAAEKLPRGQTRQRPLARMNEPAGHAAQRRDSGGENVPDGQGLQAAEASFREKVPAGQGRQRSRATEPGELKVPEKQGWQRAEDGPR